MLHLEKKPYSPLAPWFSICRSKITNLKKKDLFSISCILHREKQNKNYSILRKKPILQLPLFHLFYISNLLHLEKQTITPFVEVALSSIYHYFIYSPFRFSPIVETNWILLQLEKKTLENRLIRAIFSKNIV